jgi:HK97 family phage major capsid protein
VVTNVGIAFAQKEALAFVSGDGIAGKPRGILTVPMETGDDFARSTFFSLQYIGTGSGSPSNVQIADALVATSQKLRAPYRQNAAWLMNRAFSTVVRQLKDNNNLYLWSEDFGRIAAGQPAMLCGFPVYFDENMPNVGANATPAVLVDLKQAYQIVDRPGIGVLRDPYTARPYVGFYAAAGMKSSRPSPRPRPN